MDHFDNDSLLEKIAKAVGVPFLSDLKEKELPDELFHVFLEDDKSNYSIEEWGAAISYIFSLNTPARIDNLREVIFWNIGNYSQYIAGILFKHFNLNGIPNTFHYVSMPDDLKLVKEKKYLLFYPWEESGIEKELRRKIKSAGLNVSFVALCRDYKAGMHSIGKGDFYALKIPLEKEKIIRCYEYFCKNTF